MTSDSTQRFSDRADDYQRARPSYPDAVVTHLAQTVPLAVGATIVDVGVGTGLSAEPFLRAGFNVIGVEPNEPMRAAGDSFLARHLASGRYRSVAGRAEATMLPPACAQLLIAGQAFHWFDPQAARAEAQRVLAPGGWAALMWNDREAEGSAFLAGYDALVNAHGIDYVAIRHAHVGSDAIARFFGGREPAVAGFVHEKVYDWGTLVAQVGSSSYMPKAPDPRHAPMLAALRELFERTQQGGLVTMRYTARVHHARLA
jgi:SAM-dependent methyltransferase